MTAEELAQLGLEGDPREEAEEPSSPAPARSGRGSGKGVRRFPCPDCDRSYTDRTTLRRHRRREHGVGPPEQEPQRPAGAPLALDLEDVKAQVEEAVSHVQGMGALLAGAGAPYLGVTLAGVESRQGEVIVKSRAKMAGELLLPIAERNARVLSWVIRFNQAFRGGAVFELAGGLAAASVVDAASVSALIATRGDLEAAAAAAHQVANAGVKVGPMTVQPIQMVIPDVLEFIAGQEEEARRQLGAAAAAVPAGAPAAARNGHGKGGRRKSSREGPEVIEGGITST